MRRTIKDSQSLPFHVLSISAQTAGAFSTPLSPTTVGSTRAAAAADEWAHFRVKRLRFRLHPSVAATVPQAFGYVGGIQDTPPATVATVCELLPSCFISLNTTANGNKQTVPTEWVNVPKPDLAGPLPWYKSIPGGADATEEAPGLLVGAGTGTENLYIELRGVFEFKTSVAPANTPLVLELKAKVREERVALEKDRERTHLLGVLSSSKPPNDGKTPRP